LRRLRKNYLEKMIQERQIKRYLLMVKKSQVQIEETKILPKKTMRIDEKPDLHLIKTLLHEEEQMKMKKSFLQR